MRKAAVVWTIVFVVLTLVGAGYVLRHDGSVNAGYAVVPMVFALAGMVFRRRDKGA